MKASQAKFSVAVLCRVLGVSRSGFYAWRDRGPSEREAEDQDLAKKVVSIHQKSRGTYGVPRIHAELHAEGIAVSRKRVGKLMRRAGVQGVTRRRGFKTTVRDREQRPAPDLVQRDFTATDRDHLWVADITYIPTLAGFLFLAVVLDVFSRRIVGWSMRTHLRTELVEEALDMALEQRSPGSVIHHSDQGTQYTSIQFGRRLKKAGIRHSMGSVGDCYDNAMCESFFASLECELIDRNRWRSPQEARLAVFDYVEGWYNTHRRHSSLGYQSPRDFEAAHASLTKAA